MAGKRMCPHSVRLHNYVGEVDGRATYAVSYLLNVHCASYRGASSSSQGRGEDDTATLYIFDDILKAVDANGNELRYVPHEDWIGLEQKSGTWTLSPDGDDFFYEIDAEQEIPAAALRSKKFRVLGFRRLKQGSHRMWHFEVNGG